MMGTTPRRICLITPGHLASAPRVVKEADALAEAGFLVHVVYGRSFPAADALDRDILERARWQSTRLDFLAKRGALGRKFLRRVARTLLARGWRMPSGLAARASHADAARLATAAAGVSAELYIGHCLPGLPAAAHAARQHGAAYGFDVEDLHEEENASTTDAPADRATARQVQAALLPGCRHLTFSSPLIGAEVTRRYGIPGTTVLNAFPRRQAPAGDPAIRDRPAGAPLDFYWFSQTIGAGRGLESVLAIAARMRTPVRLRLRGFAQAAYVRQLQVLAGQAGQPPVQILPPGMPGAMAALAADADLGLATEATTPLNHDLCLANKIFVYLLAGIPQLLSPTTAQSALAPTLANAALLIAPDQLEKTARSLDEFFAAPDRVAAARRTARRLALDRYCWEVEQQAFLRSVDAALAAAPSAT